MNSSTSPPAGGDRRGDSQQDGSRGTWHPAREWLEEDEEADDDEDMDLEPESEASEDRVDYEEYDPDEDQETYDDPFGTVSHTPKLI
jgi:WD repeat-containing protein 23